MTQEGWDEMAAVLMVRMHWSYRDLCETPLSVVEAVLVRLSGSQRKEVRQ